MENLEGGVQHLRKEQLGNHNPERGLSDTVIERPMPFQQEEGSANEF
jgi:hypothetical protein